MILTIVISSVLLMLISGTVFLVVRYVPIIGDLFMNVTIRRVQDEDRALEGEDVTFETVDGVRLRGTLTPGTDGNDRPAPVVVFCHEFTSTRHSATKYAWFLTEQGFRIFAFDFRGHGDGGRSSDYIPRHWVSECELRDLRAALRYLRGREDARDAPIGLFGVSRGAVTALIAASQDDGVGAVVSDSAFSLEHTLDDYVHRWAPIFVDSRTLLMWTPDFAYSIFWRLGARLAQHRLGTRFVSVVRALRRLKTPTLFLHGENDTYIDKGQAQLLYGLAGGPKELWIVPQADHNRAVEINPIEYARRVGQFFRSTLGVGTPPDAIGTGSPGVPGGTPATTAVPQR